MRDILIIGGGQSGLAAAYYAHINKKDYQVLEKSPYAGYSWEKRWKSLTLFCPKKLSSLPGMEMKGKRNDFPTKDEMAKYMKHYAEAFQLKITYNQEVKAINKIDGGFEVQTENNTYQAKNIIMATGPFTRPYIPDIAQKLSHRIHQLHSTQYVDVNTSIQGKKVLVVGCGNSGAQIAYELATEGKKVELCVRGSVRFVPKMVGKITAFEYGKNLGLYDIKNTSWKRWLLPKRDPIVGTECKQLIKAGKIKRHPAIKKLEDDWFVFEDTMEGHYDTVLWATGFTYDFSLLKDIPKALDENKNPLHKDGKSLEVEGLYFIGLPWLTSRKSALVYGVGDDAKSIIEDITGPLPHQE